jgi:hypothetical protein
MGDFTMSMIAELPENRAAASAVILRSLVSRVFWVVAGAGAVIGAIQGGTGFYLATGAPQQAAAAALAAACAIVPYVVARAFDEVTRPRL